MTQARTLASALVCALSARGVRRAFGVPGGSSSLDILDAFGDHGIEFVLTHTETAAAIMAAVSAELSGAPGVVLTGVGPGAASVVNGIAYASLERAPVMLITDCVDENPEIHTEHQRFDQGAMFAPLTKAHRKLGPDDGPRQIERLLDTALERPFGPVHVDLSAHAARAALTDYGNGPPEARNISSGSSDEDIAEARALLAGSSRPIIIAGLDARDAPGPAALRDLADRLRCPVLTTYKAKGVFPEDAPQAVGCFTGASAEADCVDAADLIIFFGLDPIELIPHRWRFAAPVLELSPIEIQGHPVQPRARVIAPLDECFVSLRNLDQRSLWSPEEILALADALRARLAIPTSAGLTAEEVVTISRDTVPEGTRLTVDSGAHMISAMALWRASRPYDVLKSNGLSTMGFALPAAIAAALHEPDRHTLAMTGDGGLLMCVSELATAARLGCKIVVIVFNDAALSLIDVKQQRQGRASRGVRYPSTEFSAVARGLGCRAFQANDPMSLTAALSEAFSGDGPALIDVALDPSGYGAQLESLRG